MIDADKAVNTLLQTAADLANEVRRLQNENRKLRAGTNRKKLTEREVRDIRHYHRTDVFSQKEIARIYDINPATVSRIVRGLYWKRG